MGYTILHTWGTQCWALVHTLLYTRYTHRYHWVYIPVMLVQSCVPLGYRCHSILYTLGYSLHSILYSLGYSLHSMLDTLGYSLHRILDTLGYSLHSMLYPLGYSLHRILDTLGYSLHSILYTLGRRSLYPWATESTAFSTPWAAAVCTPSLQNPQNSLSHGVQSPQNAVPLGYIIHRMPYPWATESTDFSTPGLQNPQTHHTTHHHTTQPHTHTPTPDAH